MIQINIFKVESRTQELGYITRELKLLAKYLKTPIIILSQLNRSIENRTNKRPLLSDLRESGCIGYNNLPNSSLKLKNNIKYVDTLNSYKLFYYTYKSCINHLKSSFYQYTYLTICQNKIDIYVTHNHKILTETNWKKEDQLKQYNYNKSYTTYPTTEHKKPTLELNPLVKITLLNKSQVYDIEMHEYCNFLTKTQIIHNSIEQDADLVLMLYQEEKNTNNQIVDIIISKHRNGSIGSFQLLFHKHNCTFNNLPNESNDNSVRYRNN